MKSNTLDDTDNKTDAAFEGQSVATTPTGNAQRITFDAILDRQYGDADFSITATAGSGLEVTFTVSGACSIAGKTVHIVKAGTCTVTAHQDGNEDYAPAEDVSQRFHVLPAQLNVTAENKDMKYGDQLPHFTCAVSGLVNGFEPLGSIDYDIEAQVGSPAGEYAITPKGLSSENYVYNYISGMLTVKPASLTVTVEDKESIYGQPLPAFTIRIAGLVAGDTPESLGIPEYVVEAGEKSPVGLYEVMVTGLYSPNYIIECINGILGILPASLEVEVDNRDLIYGQPFPDFSATVLGLTNGDKLASLGNLVYATEAEKGSPAGRYEISASGLSPSNYRINVKPGLLNILPAPLDVTADDKTMVYGDALPQFSFSVQGLVNGDEVADLGEASFSTDAGPESTVGTYSINVEGLSSPNYRYNYIGGVLWITPARLVVTAEEKTVNFGSPLPDFTAMASGLVNGDTLETLGPLNFETPGAAGLPAGVYSITPGGLTSPNYTYIYIDGLLNVIAVPETKGRGNGEDKKVEPKDKPRLGQLLVDDGLITPQELAKALSKQLDVPAIDLSSFQIEREALNLVNEQMARKYNAIPLSLSGGYLMVAMSDPTNILAIEALTAQTKMRIKPVVAAATDVQAAIDRNYKSFGEIADEFKEVIAPVKEALLDESVSDAPAVRTLGIIIEEAIKKRASDIHIEPESDRVRLRYRIDGVMHEMMTLPFAAQELIVSRLKVLSNMNIADHRPQDGQFSFKTMGKEVDVRVATITTAYGEMGTMRILDKSFAVRTLEGIGFLEDNLKRYRKMLKSPFGMILISGPTGSGKTTTLYASINSLDRKESKIVTIEDPVEYHFDGISQIQVNVRSGVTFASGLRAIMRHDPDVVLVGEIRDAETASIAIQAALTGHLVLASIHANDAIGVIYRLLDLGVEPFLVSSALMGVVAQRMVRRVCPHCRQTIPAPMEGQVAYHEEIGEKREKFDYGKGCTSCAGTGYSGRIAVMEILSVSEEIRRMILSGVSADRIRDQARQESMVSMRHDGMLKVKEGVTTPNEILKNVFSIG